MLDTLVEWKYGSTNFFLRATCDSENGQGATWQHVDNNTRAIE